MMRARMGRGRILGEKLVDSSVGGLGERWAAPLRTALVLVCGTLVALLLVRLLVALTDSGRWRMSAPDAVVIEAEGAVRGADVIDATAVRNRGAQLTDEQFSAAVELGLAAARTLQYPCYTDAEWRAFERGFHRGAMGQLRFLSRTQR